MGRLSFENFGKAAISSTNETISASRYLCQQAQEKNIVVDVIEKLDLNPNDTLLDIGCNTGNITLPLSFVVDKVYALDHGSCLEKMKSRAPLQENISYLAYNFLDYQDDLKVDKILVYSVVHYLSDQKELFNFTRNVLDRLRPGGMALIGDLPNIDKEQRFNKTIQAKKFYQEWEESRRIDRDLKKLESIGDLLVNAPKDSEYVTINDEVIIELLGQVRKWGGHSYLLDQKEGLPFYQMRDDLLIIKPLD